MLGVKQLKGGFSMRSRAVLSALAGPLLGPMPTGPTGRPSKPIGQWLVALFGGIFFYLIGMYLYTQVGERVVEFYQAEAAFIEIHSWFESYGIWIVLIAAFIRIPYLLFSITAGILSIALVPFVLFSLVGHGARFLLRSK